MFWAILLWRGMLFYIWIFIGILITFFIGIKKR
jgi:hypothetical protein